MIPPSNAGVVAHITAITYAEADDIATWTVEEMTNYNFGVAGQAPLHMTILQATNFLKNLKKRLDLEAIARALAEGARSPPGTSPQHPAPAVATSGSPFAKLMALVALVTPPEGSIGILDDAERVAMITPKSTNFGDHDKFLRAFTAGAGKELIAYLSLPPVDISGLHPYLQRSLVNAWDVDTGPLRISWYRARLHQTFDINYSANSVQVSVAKKSDALSRPDRRRDDDDRRRDDDDSARKKTK